MKYKKFWFKQYASRVFIDDTLCFSEWLRSQRLIISPTSTSLLEAYLLKVPVINIDYLAGNAKYNRDYAVTTAEWQRSAYLPKTMKEFIQLIKYNKCKVTKNEVIEKQLKIYCNWHIPGSYNLRAAKLIKENLTFKNLGFLSSLPTWIIKLIDEYSFWKACKVNPLHPNLNYKENFHKPIKQLDQTFLNIIKDDIKTP